MEPQRIDPETPLSVTMPAREWEGVLRILRKAPYEEVAQTINAIVGQCVNANSPPQSG
jgi:hypothetical protein